ncbi:hypothetical protein WJ0W_004724 [Paenibacillus melissococcoides]|uniref:Spo0E like sporulation regulatory protein n=1 Tax=Paenibacillus melissococcoides TaxID=2912268 RepID=A0ABM9G642_9BACL|nr:MULTISPECIES: hypothetical protein [Paenibacillus]MEB9898101.1 hypothetical protein [Bacillus cereus]CAH8243601.1 hypothetical protein WJ0W_000840 [Paenibacillus melissococcoides]CAH8247336.1 hypothetical protein WJ0W_004570 [Paenibacillus melissococcoides]CAH8247489.1 hypothetical protein WJ0W_004724 [Paenibacillus melissococcoides]CAH8704989.1 hypothetical protein WDD9_000825 [Paenibacillus melissococcoides]
METKKIFTEGVKKQVVSAVLKLAEEHQLTISMMEELNECVKKHMLDNATLEKESSPKGVAQKNQTLTN